MLHFDMAYFDLGDGCTGKLLYLELVMTEEKPRESEGLRN